jgi:hypothetical protein
MCEWQVLCNDPNSSAESPNYAAAFFRIEGESMANRRSAGAVQDNVKENSPEVWRGRDDAPGCPEDEGLLYADVEAGAEGDDALGLPSAAEYATRRSAATAGG